MKKCSALGGWTLSFSELCPPPLEPSTKGFVSDPAGFRPKPRRPTYNLCIFPCSQA